MREHLERPSIDLGPVLLSFVATTTGRLEGRLSAANPVVERSGKLLAVRGCRKDVHTEVTKRVLARPNGTRPLADARRGVDCDRSRPPRPQHLDDVVGTEFGPSLDDP